ncbi:DUF924 family protein [Phreatobacter stygius]|uniref:DUF924 family protein n=1 Tax=Phreatobacter stygius TaxID=1940610 RepID=A0A4D7B9Q6_9HYPH|nr:DUF924 family protein [Phreatobacter stygius]QCI64827.1 DUF924 family protein [Phreatobacter stygius]
MSKIETPEAVLAFWRNAGPQLWFAKDEAFDAAITARFAATYEAAAAGDLEGWEATAEATLALIIVLDQFSRNMFRGRARAFWADPLALAVAERAIGKGLDRLIGPDLRLFLYLPMEHTEQLAVQRRSVALFRTLGDAELDNYAEVHHQLIARFGRFPHRNAILGRDSTPEELAFLETDGFKG